MWFGPPEVPVPDQKKRFLIYRYIIGTGKNATPLFWVWAINEDAALLKALNHYQMKDSGEFVYASETENNRGDFNKTQELD